MFDDFYLISFVPILTGLFSALSCTLVGNILVLRKQAMLSDTISHVVLPGIVISFLIFGNLDPISCWLARGSLANSCWHNCGTTNIHPWIILRRWPPHYRFSLLQAF